MTRETSSLSKPALLVTNVDSPLGHSIVRNISYLPLRSSVHLCGLLRGDDPFGGEHLCDSIVRIRENWEPADLTQLCSDNGIDLILPTTEQETVILKKNQDRLPFVLASSPEVSEIFLDKAATAQAFAHAGVRFCCTALPSEYAQNKELMGSEIILKPRRGEHSAGVVINPPRAEEFPDEHFVVQPFMRGLELTTAVYYAASGAVHSSITFIRRFVPQGSVYEVTRNFDSQILEIATKLRKEFAITGSINIQSIVEHGGVIPFEVNGRLSSSNVIRAALGFVDVQWGIEEYLLQRAPSVADVQLGSAISTRMDAIYPERKLSEIDGSDHRIAR